LLDNVGSLYAVVPKQNGTPQWPGTFKKEAEDIQSAIETVEKGARGAYQSMLSDWDEIRKSEADLRGRMQKPATAILDLADRASKEAEEKYRRFNGWSIALYSAGFIVAIFAQLLGIKGFQSEE
jgi:hypothetical protein